MAATYDELMLKARELAAAGKKDEARRVAEIAVSRRTTAGAPAAPQTNIVEQAGTGSSEGIAAALGFPVDAVTGAINAGVRGINSVAGTEMGQIEKPIGGSETFRNLLSPFMSDAEPQTAAQRYARRIGREVGFGTVMAPVAAVAPSVRAGAMASPGTYAASNIASDVGAGIAGQTAREIAPENDTLDFVASTIGGTGMAAGVNRALTTTPPAPTRAAVQSETDRLYELVRNSGADLTPQAQADFVASLQARFAREGGTPYGYPKAAGQLEALAREPRTSVYGVEEARRRMSNKVARDASEGVMGTDMVDEINGFLANLPPGSIASNSVDPQEVVANLIAARKSAHQGIKADEVTDAINVANSRTATTGTAGNSLNAQSQEIRKIYDKEVSLRKSHKSGGYNPDEVAAMEKIVFPSGGERLAQRIGRFAPTTGNLQASMATFGGGGGLVGAAATGNPMMALAAVPSAAGLIAQALAERAKGKNIDALVDVILRGGTKAAPKANAGAKAAIVSQLLNAPQ